MIDSQWDVIDVFITLPTILGNKYFIISTLASTPIELDQIESA
jgi:hypothetical protein